MIKDPPSKKKKKKPLSDPTPEPPTQKKVIPKEQLKEFVGKVDNLWKIEAVHLWEDNFRINVWTQTQEEGQITTNYVIDKSFFVCYINTSLYKNNKRTDDKGEIIDKTIQPKPQEEKRIF